MSAAPRGRMLALVLLLGALPVAANESAPGVIARRDLLRVLDAQPGAFLQHVQPEARFVGGRFYGWRLAAFFPGDERFAGIDLRAGDIVLRVNGSTCERPEQLIDVWQALRQAKELTIEIDRRGAGKRLRWLIRD